MANPNSSKKNILIVFAHCERRSFNGALLDAAVTALQEVGHEVVVSDLYAMNFNPLVSAKDISDGLLSDGPLSYLQEVGAAYERGTLAPDIVAEHAKLEAADLVILQFPLQSGGLPAIMKGYWDRVLTFKYSHDYTRRFDTGKFKGTRALLSLTTGAGEELYGKSSTNGEINMLLRSVQHLALRYSGFDVLKPNVCYGVHTCGQEKRTEMLNEWQRRLRESVFIEEPMTFNPMDY